MKTPQQSDIVKFNLLEQGKKVLLFIACNVWVKKSITNILG